MKRYKTRELLSLIRSQTDPPASVLLFPVLLLLFSFTPLKCSILRLQKCSGGYCFLKSLANAPLFRDEIEESGGATAGTHKSSQKPQKPSLLGVITGQRVISQGVRLSKARALPAWPSVCEGVNVCEWRQEREIKHECVCACACS